MVPVFVGVGSLGATVVTGFTVVTGTTVLTTGVDCEGADSVTVIVATMDGWPVQIGSVTLVI